MTDFEASNGVSVRVNEYGDIYLRGAGAPADDWEFDCNIAGALALREFFQHERDEARGLWRSPSDPTWTAVRRNTCIYFQNEDHERSFHFVPNLEGSIRAWSGDLQALAYEYIEAHPERKARLWSEARFITWRNGAYLPQTAQRDLGGMNLGWWYGTGIGDEAWHSEDALAEIIGDADVTVLVTEDAS